MIWEEALRPAGTKNGMHRSIILERGQAVDESIKVLDSEYNGNRMAGVSSLDLPFNGWSGLVPNRSAHRWDFGL